MQSVSRRGTVTFGVILVTVVVSVAPALAQPRTTRSRDGISQFVAWVMYKIGGPPGTPAPDPIPETNSPAKTVKSPK
jgi:hypothetical protein